MSDSQCSEVFRCVADFPGYRISNRGRFQSCWKQGRPSVITSKWKDLRGKRHDAGYILVTLCKDSVEVRRYVHELVLTTFCGPRPQGYVCRHLNGDPTDNRWPENICWGTSAENSRDIFKHGRGWFGEKHYKAKLTEDDVRHIRKLASNGMMQKDIAVMYKMHPGTIGDIVRGTNWGWLDSDIQPGTTRSIAKLKSKKRPLTVRKTG